MSRGIAELFTTTAILVVIITRVVTLAACRCIDPCRALFLDVFPEKTFHEFTNRFHRRALLESSFVGVCTSAARSA